MIIRSNPAKRRLRKFDELLVNEKLRDKVWFHKRKFTEDELFVLTYRYGIGGSEIRTMNEIAKELGVTRQRVNQIEIDAIKKINAVI